MSQVLNTLEEVEAAFEAAFALPYEERRFEAVANKRSARPDVHAFVVLSELVPGTGDMVAAAEHDEIFLDVRPADLVGRITAEGVADLSRCGVNYDGEGLRMFA